MAAPGEADRFSDSITLSREGRIVVAVIHRGDGLNALSNSVMGELTELAHFLYGDTRSSAVVLSGAGAFSAGFDLKDRSILGSAGASVSGESGAGSEPEPGPKSGPKAKPTLLERREALKRGPDMCAAWERLEQITIAAVERFCIGGGVALALACDHRIAATDAHFRLPEVPLGMNMSWQSNPRTVALIGPSRAKRFTILGEKLGAKTAHEWGLVDDLAEPGGALDTAMDLARRYAALPPIPLRMTKQAINAAANTLNHATSYMDRDQFLLTSLSDDQKEGVRAFVEKRPGDFKGD